MIIIIILDLMQEKRNQAAYVRYLQGLLRENKVEYKTEQQFVFKEQIKSKEFIEGPLRTNLCEQLHGEQLARYSRQMLLKQFGYEGQLKIISAKIGLIGAGGIGCPLGLYLAGAGVGTIGLFDSDVVEITNLHRQIGHKTSTLGLPKTTSLKQSLLSLNPSIEIKEHPFITPSTLSNLDEYDLIIDGSDNPKCRYLVNDHLASKGRKLLSAACVGWEGQVTCYGGDSPCYRCIWGDDQVSLGGCSTLGVVGMLPGIVAMVAAVEAVKILLTGKSSLEGHLLTYDARTCAFRKMKLRGKKAQCVACGQQKLNTQTYNYSKYETCKNPTNPPQVPTIEWAQAIQKIRQDDNHLHLDVRPSAQYNILNIKLSTNVPYETLQSMNKEELAQLLKQKQRNVYISCKSGVMSRYATKLLIDNGYTHVYNIEGGINKYGTMLDPNIINI